jgi:hypothetical protein
MVAGNVELRRMWKKRVVANFKVQSEHFCVESKESNKKISIRAAGL